MYNVYRIFNKHLNICAFFIDVYTCKFIVDTTSNTRS